MVLTGVLGKLYPIFCQIVQLYLSTILTCPYAHAAIAPTGPTKRFTDMLKSIGGRQKVHECPDDSTRGPHMLYALVKERQRPHCLRKYGALSQNSEQNSAQGLQEMSKAVTAARSEEAVRERERIARRLMDSPLQKGR